MATAENLKPDGTREGRAATDYGLTGQPAATVGISAQGKDTTIPQACVQDRKLAGAGEQGTSATAKSSLFEVLFESAIQAFVSTILVVVLGSVALGLVSGIWRQMAPSPPPGFTPTPAAEAETPGRPAVWQTMFHQHRFLLIFGIVFAATVYSRVEALPGLRRRVFHPRIQRITRRLSTDWFGLIVGNAFGAMISAIVLVWVQQFSAETWLFRWLMESVFSKIQELANHLSGGGIFARIPAWIAWYGANQLKFTFWFLYVAAVCDDLGIPNLKTLGHWLWRGRARRLSSVGADVSRP